MTDVSYDWTHESLAALRGSIAKWQGVVFGEVRDYGVVNCPLCRMFYAGEPDDEGDHHACVKCPVYYRTGESDCGDTPYEEWAKLSRDQDQNLTSGYWPKTPEQVAAAKAELDFLMLLLPKENQGHGLSDQAANRAGDAVIERIADAMEK
jgi:hypothetical protein